MRSFVMFLALLAGTTRGFLRSSSSLVRSAYHPKYLATSKNHVFNTGSGVQTVTDNNVNTILHATRLPRTRRDALSIACFSLLTSLLTATSLRANASSDNPDGTFSTESKQKSIAYRTELLPIADFGVNVPVSVWFPLANDSSKSSPPEIKYDYKISLRRIGQLLAKWEFIPEFVSKDFSLTPSTSSVIRVVDGNRIPISGTASNVGGKEGTKLVFLAHGFLGSRSDLGYIAENLASQGFVCVAPEYPESLEASYPRLEGLDRAAINKQLVPYVKDMVPQPILSYSAIGHSLGCGTVLQMGDDSWNRVLMGSGRAPESPNKTRKAVTDGDEVYKKPVVGGRLLFISSINDGLTSWGGGIQVPEEYTVLKESDLLENDGAVPQSKNCNRIALIFKGEKAPTHISYLSENVNDAMLSFLSPLLPVAETLDIPVLDFDKYKKSRDSVATGKVLKPLISSFLSGVFLV